MENLEEPISLKEEENVLIATKSPKIWQNTNVKLRKKMAKMTNQNRNTHVLMMDAKKISNPKPLAQLT